MASAKTETAVSTEKRLPIILLPLRLPVEEI
jgi:hypothetical protein